MGLTRLSVHWLARRAARGRTKIMNAKRIGFGFAAGFLAVIVFHQGAIALLYGMGFKILPPWRMTPTAPFGLPTVISTSLWGGLLGILFVLVVRSVNGRSEYLVAGFFYGLIVPTFIIWFVVRPLSGYPIMGVF